MKQDTLEKMTSDVKRDLMFYMISNMRKYELTMKDAKYLAKDFLSIFPVKTVEDLLTELYFLGQMYPEARAVFVKYAKPYYEAKSHYLLESAIAYVREGDLEKALSLLKRRNLPWLKE